MLFGDREASKKNPNLDIEHQTTHDRIKETKKLSHLIDYVMFTIFYTRAPPGGEIFKFVNVCEMLTKMAKNVLAVFSNSGEKNANFSKVTCKRLLKFNKVQL